MVSSKGREYAHCVLFSLLSLSLLTACASTRHPEDAGPATASGDRAQSLLVQLAMVNPRVAEPLVKGFSAAALERALGLVVATGLENAQWAEGLLREEWWLSEDPGTRLRKTKEVEGVLSEVRRMSPVGVMDGDQSQRSIREALAKGASPTQEEDRRLEEKKGHTSLPSRGEPVGPSSARERRAELEDAVRWVQFTRAWSSYYSAVGALVGGSVGPLEKPEVALDQAVTMSLLRPDFLDRLAGLMAEGLGS